MGGRELGGGQPGREMRYVARITGEEVQEGEPGWRKGAGPTEEEEEEERRQRRGGLRQKMNYNKKVLALHVVCLSVCLSADAGKKRQHVIHRRRYFQTELRLCSLACARLIMQITAVRQNITAAISQSGFRCYTNSSAFVSVSLTTPK